MSNGQNTDMCGRNSIGFRPIDFSEEYNLSSSPDFEPNWNVAPKEETPIVISGEDGLSGRIGMWSYYPGFGNEEEWMQRQVINARIESVHTNGAFREAWRGDRRCVIPSTGFYEWQGQRGSRIPHFFTVKETSSPWVASIPS